MPQISLPDIKLPDIRFRDGKLRDMKLPDLDLRDHLPDMNFSDIRLPGVLRDLSMPDVSMPDVKMPDLHMPDMKRVDSALASVHMPDVHMPDVNLRDLRLPQVDMAAIRRLGRPEPRRRSLLPWVVVAGVSAAFAGWWLATSPVTGPKVRAAAERVRQRIDDMRSGGSDWDDGEEKAEAFWSNESGWESGNVPSQDGMGSQEGHIQIATPHVVGSAADGEIELSDGWDVSTAGTQAPTEAATHEG